MKTQIRLCKKPEFGFWLCSVNEKYVTSAYLFSSIGFVMNRFVNIDNQILFFERFVKATNNFEKLCEKLVF